MLNETAHLKCLLCHYFQGMGKWAGREGLGHLRASVPKSSFCKSECWPVCPRRLTWSTPAAWQLVPRVVLKNASTSSPGTAGTALREPCSCPAMAACAVVRKALATAPWSPWPQVRAPLPRDGPCLLCTLTPHLVFTLRWSPSPGSILYSVSSSFFLPKSFCLSPPKPSLFNKCTSSVG